MWYFILGILCALIAGIFYVLLKTYGSVPLKELKRQARGGDEVAAVLYRVASYGIGSKIIIIFFGLLSLYFSLVTLTEAVGVWLAVPVLLAIAILFSFFVRSNGGVGTVSLILASKVSPAITWIAERLHPVLAVLERLLHRVLPVRIHSGLYEKEDLVKLLDQQKVQPDNRIPVGEIELLKHALSFGDKTVDSILVPRRVVNSVSADEDIGPILMGELHQTGHSRFPVFDGEKDRIVGILYMHDLINEKQTGKVRDVMRPKVMYVHEGFSLYQTLQAFLKTKQQLFIVVNEFEEYVGIIALEDVLEQVIGSLIVDEFDQYDDLRAVAAALARKEHLKAGKAHQEFAADADEVKDTEQ